MFEVDWQDYGCERVGQRRVRKEVEKEQKQKKNNDASSGHRSNSTLSTRTSSSSDQHHRTFFGSIGRKQPAASLKSNKPEATTPKVESTKSNGTFKRGSLRFSGITTTMMAPPTANTSTGLENKPLNIQPSGTMRNIADAMQSNSPQSADRSMTQLTVPTLESQGDEPTNDATTEIKLVQTLDDKGSSVNKVVTTTYEHGETDPFVSTRSGVGTQITAGSRTPRKTRLSRVMHPASPADDAKSASELIDDWFTALHHPAVRPALKPGPNGTFRSGGVLLPPNVIRRALPETPTRQSAKKSDACFLPARSTPIRFAADNPDDWTPVAQRKREPSDRVRAPPAPIENQESVQDEEIMRLMAADLKDIHIQEEVVRESGTARRNAGIPRAKRSAGYAAELGPRSAPMENNAETARKSGRSVRPAV
ncbi:hypothetical protein F5144DRAFT_506695 [Chaetomium tenue]|uniref:Uncharacterized protein n=1 Tax=Chaetomium tenue TaxID=1854479 RepID=A0ACB7PIT0_9PEZI|nr:hypothetical protein F5144DRAFT_506695 [Chaetomium globosum]